MTYDNLALALISESTYNVDNEISNFNKILESINILKENSILLEEDKTILEKLKDKAIKVIKWLKEAFQKIIEKIKDLGRWIKSTVIKLINNLKQVCKNKKLKNEEELDDIVEEITSNFKELADDKESIEESSLLKEDFADELSKVNVHELIFVEFEHSYLASYVSAVHNYINGSRTGITIPSTASISGNRSVYEVNKSEVISYSVQKNMAKNKLFNYEIWEDSIDLLNEDIDRYEAVSKEVDKKLAEVESEVKSYKGTEDWYYKEKVDYLNKLNHIRVTIVKIIGSINRLIQIYKRNIGLVFKAYE